MKLTILLLSLVFSITLSNVSIAEGKNATLIGRFENFHYDTWSIDRGGFFDSETITVPVNKQGNFEVEVDIDGEQNISFSFDKFSYSFHLIGGDTVILTADFKKLPNSLRIFSRNALINKRLSLGRALQEEFFSEDPQVKNFNDLQISEELEIVKLVQSNFNRKIKAIFASGIDIDDRAKFINAVYFQSAFYLAGKNLLNRYPLILDKNLLAGNEIDAIQKYIIENKLLETINTKLFYESPEYRDFIYYQIKSSKTFNYSKVITEQKVSLVDGVEVLSLPAYSESNMYVSDPQVKEIAVSWASYYKGLANINILPIRDWFLTRVVMETFQYGNIEDAQDISKDFLTRCQTKVYSDTLKRFISKYGKFAKGQIAPEIVLKDSANKTVRLSDFRGKLVYIDFWSIGCAPCMYEINHFSSRLHENYADKGLIFINICVDTSLDKWRKAITKHKIEGINLFAGGWTQSEVCQNYAIDAIPHYILIDQEGKFVKYNAERPSQLIDDPNSILHKHLKSN
jgi:peroxiredoxin